MSPRPFFYAALVWFVLILAFVLLAGCPATYNAGIRRVAEMHAKLRGLKDAQAFCLDAGLERTCGEGRP